MLLKPKLKKPTIRAIQSTVSGWYKSSIMINPEDKAIIGMAIKKANLTPTSLDRPIKRAAVMTIPDLEVPGINATA